MFSAFERSEVCAFYGMSLDSINTNMVADSGPLRYRIVVNKSFLFVFFIITWSGDELRIKIKGNDYLQLPRLSSISKMIFVWPVSTSQGCCLPTVPDINAQIIVNVMYDMILVFIFCLWQLCFLLLTMLFHISLQCVCNWNDMKRKKSLI